MHIRSHCRMRQSLLTAYLPANHSCFRPKPALSLSLQLSWPPMMDSPAYKSATTPSAHSLNTGQADSNTKSVGRTYAAISIVDILQDSQHLTDVGKLRSDLSDDVPAEYPRSSTEDPPQSEPPKKRRNSDNNVSYNYTR